MSELKSINSGTIDVTLDLRQLNIRLRDREDFHKVWNSLVRQLVGKPVSSGQQLQLTEQRGSWNMLVLDSRDVTVIDDRTLLNVIDLERPPEIRRACKEHAKNNETVFGAFYCPVCRDEKKPDRLCETHANFLENKYTAYCFEHLPHCRCRKDCSDLATFECERCRKPHAESLKKRHPQDPLTLLCQKCFIFQFELCSQCQNEGHRRLGKSRCAFPTGGAVAAEDERCGKRLCTLRHARQWQIWGPHWRGVALCEEHFIRLPAAKPAELLWMLVVSKPPAPFLQGRVKDLYRLRNIISYVRQQEFPWHEMERTLREIERRALNQTGVHKSVRESFAHLLKKIGDLPIVEERLLAQIRGFYRRHLQQVDSGSAILGVNVIRVFGREPAQSYRISIRVGRDYNGKNITGQLIGTKGVLINQLKNELNLETVDFEE